MAVFFIDLDNTMFFDGVFPPENLEAIKKARQNGNLVILNTGRGRSYIPWHRMPGIEYDGIIAGLGAYVEFGNKELYCYPIPSDDCAKIYNLFKNTDRWNKFEGSHFTFLQNITEDNRETLTSEEQLREKCTKEPILKFTCDRLTDDEEKILSDTMQIFSYEQYSEGVKKGASKGNGIKILLQHIGLSTEDCVAVGDSKNDVEMFKICKNGAAMGNSEPVLFEYCTYKARHAADGGVADAIHHFI